MKYRLKILNIALVLVLVCAFILKIDFGQPKKVTEPSEDSVVLQLLEETNQFRKKNHLTELTLNKKLLQAAMKHSEWMAANGKLDHTGKNRTSPADRIDAEGYSWSACAENIAWNYETPETVVQGWIGSRGHRQNMLGKYTETGFGYAKSSSGELYWTAVYAKP